SMLKKLAELSPNEAKPAPLLAFEAAVAARAKMPDLAAKAHRSLREPLAATPLLAALSGLLEERTGSAKVAWACHAPGLDRSALFCHAAKVAQGDYQGAIE